jgi:hypothetical protein
MAILPIAAGMGMNLLQSALSGRKRRGGYDPRMAAFDERVARAGRVGQEQEDEYLRRLRSFDPMAAATAANQAQYASAMPQIRQAVADLRGSQAGSRLNTGFGMGDQDELLERNLANLNQSMAARSMEAAQMQQGANRELGAYGMGQSNLFMDATMGRYMTEQDRKRAEQASRRGMWGNLLGAGIQAAGSFFGSRGGKGS